jgi:Uma2 family endonuclease
MADATLTKPLTLDEFVRLYETEGPFEIINGERIMLMPTMAGHSFIAHLLRDLFQATSLGEALIETAFVLVAESNWVRGSRVPDMMFYRSERLREYRQNMPDWDQKPYVLVPNLVVEIVSPGDTYSDVEDKAANYLSDGVQLVLVFDQKRRKVNVYEPHRRYSLGEEDTLTGGDVLPGFEVPVTKLFPPKE